MSKKFLVSTRLFLLIMATALLLWPLVWNGTAASGAQIDSEETDAVEDVTDAFDAFAGFTEVDADGMMDVLKADTWDLDTVGFAGDNLYVETRDGDQYVCFGAPEEIRSYLDFKGVTVREFELPVDEVEAEDVGKTDTESSTNDVFGTAMRVLLIGMLVTGLAGTMLTIRQKAEGKTASGAGETVVRCNAQAVQASQASKSVKSDVPKVRFEDVEGVPDLKADVIRLVDCLTNPGRYTALGARTPKGVILYGPPGTGKTLLAKAIAGEAKVPFLSACGSDFVEKYVGVGAKRVRELYERARRAAPCIVFIDEVDAIASKRGSDENSERDQAVNALLSELDGFDGSSGVITICATNRLELLDDAFKRAGRFDLKLAVGLPDLKARTRILEIHSRNKPLAETVDLSALAKKCAGFSGADLEALLNESAMTAAVRRVDRIHPEDIDEAFFKIVMQGNKKPNEDRTAVLRTVAWHEAGHALATKLMTDDSVPSVTIVGSASGAGGVTFRTPKDDGVLKSRKYLKSLICVMYAGRAAEEIYLGDPDLVTTGAQQDIKQATGLIREYLMAYGMGEKGMLDMSQFGRDGSSVAEEASRMATELYGEALDVLRTNYDSLEDLAMALLDKETLDEDEVDRIVGRAA